MKKRLWLEGFCLYLALTVLTTVCMRDFSPKHTVFLLLVAILFTCARFLFTDSRAWMRLTLIEGAILFSPVIVRAMARSNMGVWDVDTYMALIFSAIAMSSAVLSVCPVGWYIRLICTILVQTVLLTPIVLVWGFFFLEGSYLNVEGALAVVQTNPAEALSYVLSRGGTGFLIVGCAAIVGLIALLTRLSLALTLRSRAVKSIAGLLVFFVLCGGVFFRSRSNAMTWVYYDVRDVVANYDAFKSALATRHSATVADLQFSMIGEPGIYILVIGESQNRTHMSAYGYEKDTTPWLTSMEENPALIRLTAPHACHVQTVPALTYALTAKNQYNTRALSGAVSLLEVAHAAGFETVWVSNQSRYGVWDSPLSVMAESADRKLWLNDHIDSTDTDHYDDALVEALSSFPHADKMLIVLHLMGSHSSYHARYPETFKRFTGRSRIDEYDNSIYYNDDVMRKLWEACKSMPQFQALLYFSDHGEGIDENVSHGGANFCFAMARIPVYALFSDAYRDKHKDVVDAMRAHRDAPFTNDLVFDAMLSMMRLRVDACYEAENDITSPTYNTNVTRFKTRHGETAIAEDWK